MRERTLRQLIFEAVKVSLKQEALTKTEIHELTDYILDNSILELSAEKISLVEGNRENIKITTPFDLKLAEMMR